MSPRRARIAPGGLWYHVGNRAVDRRQIFSHDADYQDRFWNFPIGSEPHFVRVLRYVEGNALRAHLVDRAEHWRWGSLWERVRGERALLDELPIALPADWREVVNVGCTEQELKDLRSPVKRGRPRKEKGDSPLFS